MWKGFSRAWQDYRYLEAVGMLPVPGSHKIPSLKTTPLQKPDGCQFVRQPDADPFRPPDCHPAEDLKSLEGQFFPDLRISELATYSGRRMRGGRTQGRSEGIASSLRCRAETLLCPVCFGCDRSFCGTICLKMAGATLTTATSPDS